MSNSASFICHLIDFLDRVTTKIQTSPKVVHALSGGGGLVAKSGLTLAIPWTVCSPPRSSVHCIFQARILEWFAISFSRESSQPRDQTWVSCTTSRFFTNWTTRAQFPAMFLFYFIITLWILYTERFFLKYNLLFISRMYSESLLSKKIQQQHAKAI